MKKKNLKKMKKQIAGAVMLHANCKNIAFEMKNLTFKKGAFKRFLKPIQKCPFFNS